MSNETSPVSPSTRPRELRRSRNDRVLGGVCGGLGRYLGIDPLLLRIVAVALALSGGVGVVAYVIAWIAIPEAADDPEPATPRASSGAAAVVVGGVLVLVGALLLVRELVPWLEADAIWPIVVVAAGVAILFSAGRRP